MYKLLVFDKYNNMKTILNNKYIIIIPIIVLNIISLLYLYSTEYFYKQLCYIVVSFIILIILSKVNYKFLNKYSKYLYIIANLLLLLVLFVGREINGSKAWLHIYKFSIQPSEIAKLCLVIYITYLVVKKKNIFYILLIVIIPSILTFLEPDTGAIIIYLIIFLSSLKYIKINKFLVTIGSIFIILFISFNVYLYFYKQDILIDIYGTSLFYRIDRIISFKEQDNIQNVNSMISIGAHKLLYIPENHNDFIFAAIVSKYNILVFIIILSCYLGIFIYYISNMTKKKNISNIFNFMILNMLLFQVFYNILMNLSLLPIIGIPLPFLSYGGSYLVTLDALIGISINLNLHPNNRMV